MLFDWDGVICDTLAVFRSLFIGLFPALTAEADIFREYVLRLHEQGEPILPGKLSDYAADFAKCDLYPGMKKLLPYLKECDMQLAVVSTSPFATIGLQLRRHGLIGVFDEIYSSNDEYSKPNPELIRMISSRFGVQEDHTVFVGDQVSDILFVRATTYLKFFATYGFHPEAALRDAVRAHGVTKTTFFDSSEALCQSLGVLADLGRKGIDTHA